MSEKMVYLVMIQTNIRRYGWQSFALKMLTLALAAAFILSGLYSSPGQALAFGESLRIAFGVILCVLTWLFDGHYSEMQDHYANLYRDAANSSAGTFVMKLDVPQDANVKSIWRPMVVGFYVPVMAMLILLGFGVR